MAHFELIEGTVENFERTTSTRRNNGHTSTAHISMFRIDSHRVLLRTRAPSVISNGDDVVLSGTSANGQFTALACKNRSADWISPLQKQGCAFALLLFFTIASTVMLLLFSLFIPFAILMFFPFPIFTAVVAVMIKKHDRKLQKAHQMVQSA